MSLRSLTVAIAVVSMVGCGHAAAPAPVVAPAPGAWIVVPHVSVFPQRTDDDCGRAALATALSRWGVSIAANDGALSPNGGITAGALRDEVRRHGFASFVFEGTFDDLALEVDQGRPVVVGLVRLEGDRRTSHFAVVVGRDVRGDRWLTADPALGLRPISSDMLRDEWARSGWVTLVVLPT